ncbi:hypothetical protein GE061_011780 [Apolygus lucorum]|uniref:TIR domain-containing protein n=1 Tax=Apolygus lucorum TaxID=248454 RepID=A0A8S9XYC4_APOLU|nr:hypothetical protein GE061_011780 [Apolygus lucorum]
MIPWLTLTSGKTIPLAVKKKQHCTFEPLPPDPETNCHIWKDGDRYGFQGPSCTTLPRNYSIKGNSLMIKLTQLVKLHKGEFGNYSHLLSLSISTNSELHYIYPGAFAGLENLTTLVITNNLQLMYLDKDVFTGLKNLQVLTLVKNSFNSIYCMSQAARSEILPHLLYLDLSENSFGQISYNDTLHLSGTSIETLKLSYCGLDTIDSNALEIISNLSSIWLDNNNMKTETVQSLILSLAKSSPKFYEVHIGSNYFSDPNIILNTIASTNISIVDISNSHIFTLIPEYIPTSPSIRFLDFSGTLASSFEMDYFTTKKLPNVEFLYLAHNRLLDRHFAINLPKLKVLDLSDNCNLHACTSLIVDGSFMLNESTNLEVLNLNSNSIYSVTIPLLKGLFSLRELRLSNASLQHIEIGAFSDLHNLEILDLSNNILTRNSEINNMTFKGLSKLANLYLDQAGLTCLEDSNTFQHTPLLRLLSLKQNTFLELHPTLLTPLKELNFLDLSQNSFQNWDRRIFQGNPNLQQVDLSYNQISAFSAAMLEDLSGLSSLDLAENSLSCECSDVSILFPYLNSTADKNGTGALTKALSTAICFSPERMRFGGFLHYVNGMNSNKECVIYNETVLIIKVVILVTGLFFLVSVPTVYFLRWHIKYWIFLLRQAMTCYIFPKKKHPEPEGKYTYDAFVSYSNEDRGFVVRLVSMLESHSPHFSLCVYERDFNVGGVITDNVVDCLSKSRRTILVLSDSFAKSTWCQWEMNLAQHKRLFFKDDHHGPLIIIKIGEIMEKHMTPTLRYLIKTRIYLQWNSDPIKQKVFWEKLRSALAAPLNDDDGRPSLQHSVITNGDTINNNNITHNTESAGKTAVSSKRSLQLCLNFDAQRLGLQEVENEPAAVSRKFVRRGRQRARACSTNFRRQDDEE